MVNPMTYTFEALEAVTEAYNDLADKIEKLVDEHPQELLGDNASLWQHIIHAPDMTLTATPNGIDVRGGSNSAQTCDYEFYDFTVPYAMLNS